MVAVYLGVARLIDDGCANLTALNPPHFIFGTPTTGETLRRIIIIIIRIRQ
jgi:hypothetical protein